VWAIFILAATMGCARHRETLVGPGPIPIAPSASEVMSDLRQNDERLVNFRAAGTFTLESPKLDAVERFPSGMIAFRRPADWCVEGRIRFNVIAFRLKCTGDEFLMEFPTRRDENRYLNRLEGDEFENVPFSVSPSDIAHELFMPIGAEAESVRRVRIDSYDSDTRTAVLSMRQRSESLGVELTRRVTVTGPPWILVKSELIGEDGATLAESSRAGYEVISGVRFPSFLEAWFPGERTRMTFELRNVRVNTELDDSLFRITWRP
jgi:hypothetical protein